MQNYELVGHTLARGGGGGSSSGGGFSGGGGGFSGGSSTYYGSDYSSNTNYSGSPVSFWFILLFFLPFIIFFILIFLFTIFLAKKTKAGTASSAPNGFREAQTEEEKKLVENAKTSFEAFQKAWSDYDLSSMKKIVDADYYSKMELELEVLKNYERQNLMEEVNVSSILIKSEDNYKDEFTVFIVASAKDQLLDKRENKIIFTDNSEFSEIWSFKISNGKALLSSISQTTAESSKFDQKIYDFSEKNKFFYDADFGWLMMPSRGAIFGPAGFGNADINNHVIGKYKNKIVEFYSYEPRAGAGLEPITVAQAILPKRYDDILVTEKSWYNFRPKAKGLVKVETESVDFNKKFCIWAAEPDKATSFELLATNFMEKIYGLSFELNIEVVDNVLYLYSPGLDLRYDEMLEVLSWAFEEMKM